MSTIFNYFASHKIRALGLLVLVPLVAVGVYLALNPTIFRSKASGTRLILETGDGANSITTQAGQTARVYVSLDPGGAEVVGVDAVILYNSEMFDVADSDINIPPENGRPFGKYPLLKVESPGKIRISALAVTPNVDSFHSISTRVVLANVVFHAKKDGTDTITFGQDSIIADRQANNIVDLNNFQPLTLTVTSGNTTPAPVATQPPAPQVTQSATSPYACTVQDVLVQDATTGQAITTVASGTKYSLFVTMAINGWTIDPTDRSKNDNPPLFNYMTLFNNADQINIPQTSCLWSASKSAFVCSWEGSLTASSGTNNLRLFLRNYSGSTEVTSCTKNGSPIIATYTGS